MHIKDFLSRSTVTYHMSNTRADDWGANRFNGEPLEKND